MLDPEYKEFVDAHNAGVSLTAVMNDIHIDYTGYSQDMTSDPLMMLESFSWSERKGLQELYAEHVSFAEVKQAQDNFLNLDADVTEGERAYRKAFVELLLEKGRYVGFLDYSYYGMMSSEIIENQVFAIRNCYESSISSFAGTFADSDDMKVGIVAEVLRKDRTVDYVFAEITMTDVVAKIREK